MLLHDTHYITLTFILSYRWCFTRDLSRKNAARILKKCREEVNCEWEKKKNIIREKIRAIMHSPNKNNRYKYDWKIGGAPHGGIDNVCKVCFMTAYDVGHSTVDTLIHEIKVCSNCNLMSIILICRLIA